MELQQAHDILVVNIGSQTGVPKMSADENKSEQQPEGVTGNVPEPEWITISQAIEHPDCPVKSRQTLHAMIERGDIPEQCIDKRPYGERHIVYIDANCLPALPYKEHGKRGVNKH